MKKRGFTLIELLAVIVILAIIALIAVPVVMNIITKARKSAFKDSAYGIIKAGELYYAGQLLTPNGMTEDKTFVFPEVVGLDLKGSKPAGGSMKVTKEGDIVLAINDGKYCVKKGKNDSEVTIDENIEDCTLPAIVKTLSEIATTEASLGVTSVNSCATRGTCANGTAFAIKVNDTETHKFYVIKDTGTELTLIMDRNVGNTVEWISEEDVIAAGGARGDWNNNIGPLTALTQLETLTNGWTNIEAYNYTLENDDDGLSGSNTYESILRQGVRARMLTYTEANTLADESGNLPEYLSVPIDDNDDGYWTSSIYSDNSDAAWVVSYNGYVDDFDVRDSRNYGVRPVISIPKSAI